MSEKIKKSYLCKFTLSAEPTVIFLANDDAHARKIANKRMKEFLDFIIHKSPMVMGNMKIGDHQLMRMEQKKNDKTDEAA